MALPSYSTGTATVDAGGTSVALTDATTAFNNVFAGDTFCIGTAIAKVIDVVDDEHFTITPWPGGAESDAEYVVLQDSSLRFTDVEIAIDLKKQVQALNTEGFYVFVPSSATEPDPSLGDDGQYAFQAATGKLWARESGAWVFRGVYKGFGLPTAYDEGKTYSLFDTATLDGSTYVWINAASGSGHAPPDATYWNLLAGKGEKGDPGEPGEQGAPGTDGADGLGVPSGGATGQVLAKASAADNDTGWIDPPQSLPSGGTTGQVLAKASATDGDADWIDPPAGGGRELLTADRTYYVSTTGSDSNNGLSSGQPFLTVQHAVDMSLASLDFGGFTVTIQLADGTYTGAVNVTPGVGIAGASKFLIKGNASTPVNVIVNTTGTGCFTAQSGGIFRVQDMELRTTTGGTALGANDGSYVEFQNIRFGACANNHMTTTALGRIKAVGNYSIVGGAINHVQVGSGVIRNSNFTVTLIGTPAFSNAFALIERAGIFDSFSVTYSGSATGTKYVITSGGVLYTNGAGGNYLPGSVNGSTGTTSGGGFIT